MFKKIKLYISTRKWLGLLLQILFAVALLFAITIWQTRHATRGEAPDFSGTLINQNKVNLQEYRGKPLLLHFWATWCPVCKLEQHTISSLANETNNRHFRVITIASWSGNELDISNYMRQENLDFPVLVDNDGNIAKLYGVNGVPSSFIIDSNGFIQFVEQGYTTEIGLRLRLWWLKNN